MPSIPYRESQIEFETKVNPRARRLLMRVRDGKVIVTTPRAGLEKQAGEFVQQNARWVLAQLNKEFHDSENRFVQNICEEILFFGVKYPVELIPTKNKRARLGFDGQKFNLEMPDEQTYDNLKSLLEKWYKLQAKQILPKLVAELGYADKVSRICIKGQKTCWGSCSRRANLNFNWKLMMAPEHVVKYILIHELSHLEQLNHSDKFWQIVEEKCPDYRLAELWIKKNGNLLNF